MSASRIISGLGCLAAAGLFLGLPGSLRAQQDSSSVGVERTVLRMLVQWDSARAVRTVLDSSAYPVRANPGEAPRRRSQSEAADLARAVGVRVATAGELAGCKETAGRRSCPDLAAGLSLVTLGETRFIKPDSAVIKSLTWRRGDYPTITIFEVKQLKGNWEVVGITTGIP